MFVESEDSSSDLYSNSDDSSSTSTDSDESIDPPKAKRQRKNDRESIEAESNFSFCLKSNFKWIINDFRKVLSEHKAGEKVESPLFIVGYNEEFKWRLELCPRGIENKNYTTLYLCLISSPESKIGVHYNCSILNEKNASPTVIETFKPGDRLAVRKFRLITDLLKICSSANTRGFTILCELSVIQHKPSLQKIKVINDLEVLLDSGSYSDVTLEIENKNFKVHKNILASRSAVFDAMFKHDMKEKKNNVVQISDISYAVMKELLRFIYTGEVENINNIAKELLAAADKYAFEDLKIICENSLHENLSIDNVVEILNFAELYSTNKLKKLALNYFVNHVEDVVETPSFKQMGDRQSPLLAQIIRLMANKK